MAKDSNKEPSLNIKKTQQQGPKKWPSTNPSRQKVFMWT
jgi:hypothetical protein